LAKDPSSQQPSIDDLRARVRVSSHRLRGYLVSEVLHQLFLGLDLLRHAAELRPHFSLEAQNQLRIVPAALYRTTVFAYFQPFTERVPGHYEFQVRTGKRLSFVRDYAIYNSTTCGYYAATRILWLLICGQLGRHHRAQRRRAPEH